MLKISFEEDQRLKRCVDVPKDQKPRYNWGEIFGADRPNLPQLKIAVGGEDREFDVTEIADTVGTALTDLLLSRDEREIFTEKNRVFVAQIATWVADRLSNVVQENGARRLEPNDLYLVIEKALVENDAHGHARQFAVGRLRFDPGLQQVDGCLELGDRGADVRELDDVGLGPLRQLPELSRCSAF